MSFLAVDGLLTIDDVDGGVMSSADW